MTELLLGKTVSYTSHYDNLLLFPIARSLAREKLGIRGVLPFKGYDLWNCYEVSWLNAKGKPEARIMSFIVPAESKYLLESKSIKLYLNSFNNTYFTSDEEVSDLIKSDLSNSARAPVEVYMHQLGYYNNQKLQNFSGVLLDVLDIGITEYEPNHNLLALETANDEMIISETLYSNLLKSNCMVTGQPDWASIQIKYKGRKINHESLLKYLVAYRNHSGFHEDCIENIFVDILNRCKPKELTVLAKYTRRGGVDINPFRTNLDLKNTELNKIRDVRQ